MHSFRLIYCIYFGNSSNKDLWNRFAHSVISIRKVLDWIVKKQYGIQTNVMVPLSCFYFLFYLGSPTSSSFNVIDMVSLNKIVQFNSMQITCFYDNQKKKKMFWFTQLFISVKKFQLTQLILQRKISGF